MRLDGEDEIDASLDTFPEPAAGSSRDPTSSSASPSGQPAAASLSSTMTTTTLKGHPSLPPIPRIARRPTDSASSNDEAVDPNLVGGGGGGGDTSTSAGFIAGAGLGSASAPSTTTMTTARGEGVRPSDMEGEGSVSRSTSFLSSTHLLLLPSPSSHSPTVVRAHSSRPTSPVWVTQRWRRGGVKGLDLPASCSRDTFLSRTLSPFISSFASRFLLNHLSPIFSLSLISPSLFLSSAPLSRRESRRVQGRRRETHPSPSRNFSLPFFSRSALHRARHF